jgi:hypothetical protein
LKAVDVDNFLSYFTIQELTFVEMAKKPKRSAKAIVLRIA